MHGVKVKGLEMASDSNIVNFAVAHPFLRNMHVLPLMLHIHFFGVNG